MNNLEVKEILSEKSTGTIKNRKSKTITSLVMIFISFCYIPIGVMFPGAAYMTATEFDDIYPDEMASILFLSSPMIIFVISSFITYKLIKKEKYVQGVIFYLMPVFNLAVGSFISVYTPLGPIFVTLFLMMYLVIDLIKKDNSKKMVIITMMFIALSAVYLLILINGEINYLQDAFRF